jgi:FAD/FMN-containing dehydrogenase
MSNPSISPELLDRFAAIVGDRYALRSEADLAPHLIENRGSITAPPRWCCGPARSRKSLRSCAGDRDRNACRAADGNTGLVGGQTPRRQGEIMLSLERMNRIRESIRWRTR